MSLKSYIYILSVFTEKPNSKPLDRDAVYIPMITSSHATSMTSKLALYNLIGSLAIPQLAGKLRVNIFLLQF